MRRKAGAPRVASETRPSRGSSRRRSSAAPSRCARTRASARRLHEWNEAGVWQRLHQVLLDELQDAGQRWPQRGGLIGAR
jgi:hypothetical protein